MTEAVEYARLRRDLGVSEEEFPNEEAELYFVESAEKYPSDTAKMTAYVRVLVIQGLLPGGIGGGKYTQNQSVEDFTGVADDLWKWLEYWEDKVATAADPVDAVAGIFFTVARGRRGQ